MIYIRLYMYTNRTNIITMVTRYLPCRHSVSIVPDLTRCFQPVFVPSSSAGPVDLLFTGLTYRRFLTKLSVFLSLRDVSPSSDTGFLKFTQSETKMMT